MTIMQIKRTPTPGNSPLPNSLAEGELAVDMAEPIAPRLWVGVPAAIDPTGIRLVSDMSQAAGDYVNTPGTQAWNLSVDDTDGAFVITDATKDAPTFRIAPVGNPNFPNLPPTAPPMQIDAYGGVTLGGYSLSFGGGSNEARIYGSVSTFSVGMLGSPTVDPKNVFYITPTGASFYNVPTAGATNRQYVRLALDGIHLYADDTNGPATEDMTIEFNVYPQSWDIIGQSSGSSLPGGFTIADRNTGTRRLNIHPGATGAPVELLATGELILALDPTSPMGAVTKQYADAITAGGGNFLPLAGGTLTGDLLFDDGLGGGTVWGIQPQWATDHAFVLSEVGGAERFRIAPSSLVGAVFPVIIDADGDLTVDRAFKFGNRPGVFPLQSMGPSIWSNDIAMRFESANQFVFYGSANVGNAILSILSRSPVGGSVGHVGVNGSLAAFSLQVLGDSRAPDADATISLTAVGNQSDWDLIAQSPDSSNLPGGFTIADAVTGTRRLNIHAGSVANSTPVEILATGELILALDPTSPMGAVTKQYADAITAGTGVYVPVDGSVPMTGALSFTEGPETWTLGAVGMATNTFAIRYGTATVGTEILRIDLDHSVVFQTDARFYGNILFGGTGGVMDPGTTGIFFAAGTMVFKAALLWWFVDTNGQVMVEITAGGNMALNRITVRDSIYLPFDSYIEHSNYTFLTGQDAPGGSPGNNIDFILWAPGYVAAGQQSRAFTISDSVGGTTVGQNFYHADVHNFTSRDGLTPYGSWDATGLHPNALAIEGALDTGGNYNSASILLTSGAQSWKIEGEDAGSSTPSAFSIGDSVQGERRLIIEPSTGVVPPIPVVISPTGNLAVGRYVFMDGQTTGDAFDIGGPLIYGGLGDIVLKFGDDTSNRFILKDYNDNQVLLISHAAAGNSSATFYTSVHVDGILTLAYDPVNARDAVTKQYVDAAGGSSLINWSVTEAGTVAGAYTITDTISGVERLIISPGTGRTTFRAADLMVGPFVFEDQLGNDIVRINALNLQVLSGDLAVGGLPGVSGNGGKLLVQGQPGGTGPYLDNAIVHMLISGQGWALIAQGPTSVIPGAFTITDVGSGAGDRFVIQDGTGLGIEIDATGFVSLLADPTLPMHAATKQYVDNSAAAASGGATISDLPPATPTPGQLWFNSATTRLAIWYDDGTSAQWITV